MMQESEQSQFSMIQAFLGRFLLRVSVTPWWNLRPRQLRHAASAPHLRCFYRIKHQHRNRERANAAWDRGHGAGKLRDSGMHVADQSGAFLPKSFLSPG